MLPTISDLGLEIGGAVDLVILLRGSPEDARLMQKSVSGIQVLSIGEHDVADAYRVRVSPYLTVIDRKGLIRAKGLINERRHIEHFLMEAGLKHPAVTQHALEGTQVEVA